MRIERPADVPARDGLSWADLWNGPDDGLIAAWEAGRTLAQDRRDLAAQCQRGALPELPWKTGARPSKAKKKPPQRFGSFLYVAMWQGLRGDALAIDTDTPLTMTCRDTGFSVTYTSDRSRWAGQDDSETD
jgi:hypothetical protein